MWEPPILQKPLHQAKEFLLGPWNVTIFYTLKAIIQIKLSSSPLNYNIPQNSMSFNDLQDLPLWVYGTPFQKKVWQALCEKVPFAKTASYQDLAHALYTPNASRAVGTALGKNPLAPIIPCHRILPKSGGVGNYGYGPQIKKYLLEEEQKLLVE